MKHRLPVLIAAFVLVCSPFAAAQGTKPAPKTAKPPAKTAPATKKPPAAPAAAAPAPAPAPPSDVRYTAKYTAGEQVTESTSFFTDKRERYELGDIILIKQRDQNRNVQISRTANTYVIVPDMALAAATPAAPKPPGVVMMTTSFVDLGERKDMFGHTARRVRTIIERLPEPGACDQTKLRSDTDAWYIDMPKALAAVPDPAKAPGSPSGCLDEIKTSESGDAKLLGFPISYRTTLTDLGDKDAKPTQAAMEITEFEVLRLDNALFDIPPGLAVATDTGGFSKAISDANESKLASGGGDASVPAKEAGNVAGGRAGSREQDSADGRHARAARAHHQRA